MGCRYLTCGQFVLNILVIDDHRLFRDGLMLVLKRLVDIGEVYEAGSGQEALSMFTNLDLDLIIIDYHLPDMIGPMLLRKIKQETPEVPVLLMSGSEEPAMIRSALEGGSSGFIPKSADPDEILDAINLVMQGEIYVPPKVLEKLEKNQLDVNSAGGLDYADLMHLAKVTKKVIETSDWSIRAKHDQANRPEAVEAFNDMLEKMESQYNELRQHAFHDPLTDLPNRRLFDDRIIHALHSASRKSQKLALIAMDLDFFKQINDTYGHDQGDALLRIIAARLKKSIRKVDTACRLGGDEFLVLLAEVESNEAVQLVVKRMFNALTEEVELGGVTLSPSVSMGVAISHGEHLPAELFKRADDALYEVKHGGKNSFRFFHSSLV